MKSRKKSKKKTGPDSKVGQKKDENAIDKKTDDYGGLPDRDLKKNLGCG